MSHSPYEGQHAQQPFHGQHAATYAPARTSARAIPVVFACTLVLIATFVVFMALSPVYVANVLGGSTLTAGAASLDDSFDVSLDVQENVTNRARLAFGTSEIKAVGRWDENTSLTSFDYACAYVEAIAHADEIAQASLVESASTYALAAYEQYSNDDEQTVLRMLYVSLSSGKPVVLHMQQTDGSEHWVTVVGFQGVYDLAALSLDNFLVIDPAAQQGTGIETLASRGYTLLVDDGPCAYISPAAATVVTGDQIETTIHGVKGVRSSGTTQWERLASTRDLSTMAAIADEGFSSCDTVVLASRSNYADALLATALAGTYGSPLLLTDASSLSSQARDEIARLLAGHVIIVGSEGTLSPEVERQLVESGISVTRIEGETFVDTALEVYRAGMGSWGDTAIVVSANDYQDALSIVPYAYANHAPVFLATGKRGQLDATTYEVLEDFEQVVIIGGADAVADSVEVQLEQLDIGVVRLMGTSASETSLAVSAWCIEQGLSADGMGVVFEAKDLDALVAGAFCGRQGSALVLASEDGTTETFIAGHASHMARAWIFGDSASVPTSVVDRLMQATARS